MVKPNKSSEENQPLINESESDADTTIFTTSATTITTSTTIITTPSSSSIVETTQIEISTNPLQTITTASESNSTLTNTPTAGNNFAEHLSTRQLMERRLHERTQNWRTNITNVLHEISPLVQHAQSVQNNSNVFNAWISPQPTSMNPSSSSHGRTSTSSSCYSSSSQSSSSSSLPQRQMPSNRDYIINLDNNIMENANTIHQQQHNQHLHHHNQQQFYHHHHHHNQHNNQHNDLQLQNGNADIDNSRSVLLNGQSSSLPHNNSSDELEQYINDANNNQQDASEQPVADAFTQMPEARRMLKAFLRYLPYVAILTLKSCYDHLDGILNISALFITFLHANYIVRQEIAKQNQRSVFSIVRELFYIVLVVGTIGIMLEKNSVFISVIFASSFTDPFTLRNLLFSVAITDLILKLITVSVKLIITMLPQKWIEYKGRGRIFLIAESVSQLYRALAPIQPWLYYLLDSYSGFEKLLGVGFSAAYMVAKGADLLKRAVFVKQSFIEFFRKVNFGQSPSKEQLQTAGAICPICHDAYTQPVLLECGHIFCEMCVGLWFDREQTCPLCRAKVANDPAWRDGATTFFVQLY